MSRQFNPERLARRRRELVEAREAEKAARLAVLASTRGRAASMGPSITTAAPKTEPARCPALLEMARGRKCLLCILTGQHVCHPDSTVAAHSNLGIHGKSLGRKADDCYSVWLGDLHHRWLDQGTAPAATKEAGFMAAHVAQVDHWRRIATDRTEPERFRRAARWALEMLNASPVIDLETAP